MHNHTSLSRRVVAFNTPSPSRSFNMLLAELTPILRTYWPLLLLSALAVHLLRNKFHNGLNKFPGQPVAAYTNWWRFFDALGRKAEKTHVALHRKHGDTIRLGPNVLSFADPRAIKIIYGLNKGMVKSDFYPVQQAVVSMLNPSVRQALSPAQADFAGSGRPRVSGYSRSSAPKMRITTRSTVAASTTLSLCLRWSGTSRWWTARPMLS